MYTMEKVLILSQEFDYSRLIAYDAGPVYAMGMGWKYDFLNNIELYQNSIKIIDSRITESECFEIESYLQLNKNSFFLFKIIDPYQESCPNNYYYHFFLRIKNFENVFFLTPYIPQEAIQELNIITMGKKVIFSPYPFNDIYNIEDNLASRTKKIIFSGSSNPSVYPYRVQFLKKVKFNPCLYNKVSILRHPGYPDVGDKLVHEIIGDKYIEYLSQFMFMFISPSRCGLEFLKYSECAYAHCVPVGKSPLSFSPQLKKFFIELNFDDLYRSIKRIFSMPVSELEDLSKQYYLTYQQERNPELLNSQLDNFLEEVLK